MTHHDPDPKQAPRRRWPKLLGISLFVLWVACDSLVPRQGWDSKLGPVVPHDTFPGDCSLCHMGSDWHTLKQEFAFDHAKETGVPLNGAHADVTCLLCHNDRGPVKQFAAQGCNGCHADPHRGQLGRTCTDCHDERTWQPNEVIQKHDRTRFPLVGAHAATPCFRCHPGAQVGNFAGASTECQHCHAGEFTRSSFDHVAQGFTQDCQRCHRPVGWLPAQFQHPASFPLTQGHGNRTCNSCHQPGVYTGLNTTCSSCHLPRYQATTNPPHAANNFPTTCNQCHSTSNWGTGSFQHSASFPLTNGHSGLQCMRCHTGGVFVGLPTTCVSCHLSDYTATTNPPHAASNFPQTCQQCHNTRGWSGANFVHSANFPLTNGHSGLACTRCHTTGNYVNIPRACVSCHQATYNATSNPSHTAYNFSTTCENCHDTRSWGDGTFTHRFPITSGAHRNMACNNCHVSGIGSTFECIQCHEHRQSSMNSEHNGVNGYQWVSARCYACHPNGRG